MGDKVWCKLYQLDQSKGRMFGIPIVGDVQALIELDYCFSNFNVLKNHLRVLFNLITMAEMGEFTNY